MTLYIDIDNKKLVQSATSERSVLAPVFMQGDNEPLEIHLLKRIDSILTETQLSAGDSIRVGIGRFHDSQLLSFQDKFTVKTYGADVVLPLNTVEIEQALDGREYISAILEVECKKSDGSIITLLQSPCRLQNDIIPNTPSVNVLPLFYTKGEVDTLFDTRTNELQAVYDEQGNLIPEKVVWRTVKIADGVYTQKWIKL